MLTFQTRGDGIDALSRQDVPSIAPQPDSVVVRMHACSLNYRDLLVVKGIGAWKPLEPRVPLSDGAGEIIAVGHDVQQWKKGDRVAGIFLPRWQTGPLTEDTYAGALGGPAADGVLAESVEFHEDAIVQIPDHMTFAEAATLPVAALTAWHAVALRSNVQSGDTVLIQGTGGVSLFALQIAVALGAVPVLISSSDDKLEFAKQLGAKHLINYKKVSDWESAVLEITGGIGVDHVVEVVGGTNLNRSLNSVKIGGTISFIGLMDGLAGEINTYQFVARNVDIHGIETGSRQMFEEMNQFLELHRIAPVIDSVVSADDPAAALRHLEQGSHVGKVVLAFDM